jgi:hypothetical protein
MWHGQTSKMLSAKTWRAPRPVHVTGITLGKFFLYGAAAIAGSP